MSVAKESHAEGSDVQASYLRSYDAVKTTTIRRSKGGSVDTLFSLYVDFRIIKQIYSDVQFKALIIGVGQQQRLSPWQRVKPEANENSLP